MKKRYLKIFLLLFIYINVSAESCVTGLNVTGKTYRVNGHQNMWLPNGNFTYKGSLPSSDCFEISKSDIVAVRVSGSNFQFQPHKFGNASIRVSVKSNCLCDGISSLGKTVYFKLSEWGLKKLSVKGYKISPEFYNGTMDYTLKVPYSTDEIVIEAEPNWPTSTIKGDGVRKLNVGNNKLVINVTTTQGDSRDYTITVTRGEPVNPTSIKINENDIKMHVSDKEKLTYTVTPIDAKIDPKWESNYPSVISVTNGTITALKSGTATITIKDGNLSDSITVTAIPEVYDIKTDDNITLFKNESKKIEYSILPENAIDKEVTFTSNDETLLKVSNDGIIKSTNKVGTGTITITSKESGFRKNINVTVKSKLERIYFDIHELELRENETKKLNVNIQPSDAEVTLNFTSSDPNIVSINNVGVIKGLKKGNATIKVSTPNEDLSDNINITVLEEVGPVVVPPDKKNNNIEIYLILAIIIVSMIIIIMLLSMKKNKSKK